MSNAIEIIQGEAEYFTSATNPKYGGYPCYHLLIVHQHPYLLSSIGKQPLLKLSCNNSITTLSNFANSHMYTHFTLLTVLFYSIRTMYFTFSQAIPILWAIFNGQFTWCTCYYYF